MSELIVTTADMRTIPGFSKKPGFCVRQARPWAERHGIDWKAFKRDGVAADVLLATGDGFAIALVAWARKRREEGADGQ